jgi:dephospho-CoA kinase
MKAEMRNRLAACESSGVLIAVLEAAVLIEAGWDDLVDEVWVVSVPPEEAADRLMQRNGLTNTEAQARLATQLSNAERAARADVVIENNGGVGELSTRVDALWESVVERAA